MSVESARELAKKARRTAPPELYGVVRHLEKAIEELIDEIEALKQAKPGASKSARSR